MFLNFIKNNINMIIISFGVLVAIAMIINYVKLIGQKSRITEVISRKQIKFEKNEETKEFCENEIDDPNVNPNMIRVLEKQFNKLSSRHGIIVQMIPIFPLLGILGTIAGLILQTKAGADSIAMMSSLDTALESTLYGVFASIVLKFIDALPTYVINGIEIVLDDYDKKMNILEMYENIIGHE